MNIAETADNEHVMKIEMREMDLVSKKDKTISDSKEPEFDKTEKDLFSFSELYEKAYGPHASVAEPETPGFHLVSQLVKTCSDLHVIVKVFRAWKENVDLVGDAMHLIVVDKKGDKIEATIPEMLVAKFEDVIEEGGSYLISNVDVSRAEGDMRKTRNDFKIRLTRNTKMSKVSPISEKQFFDFVKFEKIIEGAANPPFPFVDVMGGVVKVHEIRSFVDVYKYNWWDLKNRYLEFTLRNEGGVDLRCVATKKYANEVFKKFKRPYWEAPPLCILKLWKVVRDAEGEVMLTNDEECSEIILDPIDEQFEEFKNMVQFTELSHHHPEDIVDEWRYQMDI